MLTQNGDSQYDGSRANAIGDDQVTPKYEEAFPPLPQSTTRGPTLLAHNSNLSTAKSIQPLKQSLTTQVFQIPQEERRFKFTPESQQFGSGRQQLDLQRRACQEIAHKSNCKIDLSNTKDRTLTVAITGKPEQLLQAKRHLIKELQTQASDSITVPREYHKFILGKGGAKLKDIELTTSTKINLSRANEEINIVGTKEGIDLAKHEIAVIVDEQSKLAFERISVPKIYHPFILGPYSKYLNDLREKTKATINVPPASNERDEITVAGEKNGVKEAVDWIMRTYQEKERKCQSVEIDVKKSQHRYVIGVRGSGLSDILEKTGVSVEVPSSYSDSTKIRLRGHPDQLGSALTKVYEKAGSCILDTVPAKGWLHRFIIGKQGAGLQKILEGRDKVRVDMLADNDTIEVEGPSEDVEYIVDLLKTKVADLEGSMAKRELEIDPKYHKHIVGKAGSNIAKLQQDHLCSINIPNNQNMWTVTIIGDPNRVDDAKKEIEAMVNKIENEKQKDVIIEQRYHRMLIGTQGSSIRELRDKFPQVNINFPDSNEKSNLVVVRGPRQAVDQAAQALMKIYHQLIESNYSEDVKIFKQFHKNIIGKGGATIKAIREATNTKIELPDERNDSDVIRVTGKKKDVQEAVKKIEAIQKELANIKESTVTIPARLHTSLIGSKGKLIRAIQEECGGVQINFPDQNSSGSDRVLIRGPAQDVDKAQKQLLDLASQKEAFSFEDCLLCTPEYHKFLIGKKGANIEQIRQSTGARVIFPDRDDEEKNKIQLVGSKEAVAKAKEELSKRIKDMENVVEEVIIIDPKWHRNFLLRRGQKLDELSRDYGGVNISFPKQNTPLPEGEKVKVKGPKDCVQAVIERVKEIISDLASQVTEELIVPQIHHRAMIGRSGELVRDIQRDYNVIIKFPEAGAKNDFRSNYDNSPTDDVNGINGHTVNGIDVASETESSECNSADAAVDPSTIIQITGRVQDCQSAKDALLQLVPITEEVVLENEFHKLLIGQRGQGVQEMTRAYNVQINIPDAGKNLDCITVKGTNDRINKFRCALVEKISQWEIEREDRALRNHEVEVSVPVRYHRQIIGSRGATINELRDTFGVQISMPTINENKEEDISEEQKSSEENGDADTHVEDIVIRGYQEKAEAARDKILELVKTWESYAKEELNIPHKVHPRLIGNKGRSLKQIMSEYKVDITFPGRDAEGDYLNVVRVVGEPENVDRACDHLISRANEMIDEMDEWEEQNSMLKDGGQFKGRGGRSQNKYGSSQPGFIVSGAPWAVPDTQSQQDFPSIGDRETSTNSSPKVESSAWGGKFK